MPPRGKGNAICFVIEAVIENQNKRQI